MEPLYNRHHWDQRFVLYKRGVFTRGVIFDHAPFTIVSSYAGARLWAMKSVVLTKYLALRPESGTYLGYIAIVGCRYLPILMVGVAKCPLCEVA